MTRAGGARMPGSATPRAATGPGVGSGLVTLFTVQFRHDYYNAADGQCRDFVPMPTPGTAALMGRLGIAFVDQGDGFSIVIPQARIPAMMDMIVRDFCPGPVGAGYWTRLTFLMVLKNDDFVGITAWPIDTSPMRQALYTDNLTVRRKKDGLQLGGAGGLDADTLLPTTSGAIGIASDVQGTVTACDISGKPVASVDTGRDMPAVLSLAGLPYGFYTIRGVPDAAYTGPPELVYVPPAPRTTGLIDLLLTRPDATTGMPSAFPVPTLPSPPPPGLAAQPVTLNPVRLIAQFTARATYWQYYVVPQGSNDNVDLSIRGKGTKFRKSADLLPNGDTAVLFSATAPLPLRQRTSYRFSLDGRSRSGNGGNIDIHVDPLPSPAAAPIWPVASEPLAGGSEIFVYV